jgi:hypothetical protein
LRVVPGSKVIVQRVAARGGRRGAKVAKGARGASKSP